MSFVFLVLKAKHYDSSTFNMYSGLDARISAQIAGRKTFFYIRLFMFLVLIIAAVKDC